LVRQRGIKSLPCSVWETRFEYQDHQPPEHLCRNIGLLYDNPYRIPADIRQKLAGPQGRSPR
jgi:hypothetical protein